MIYVMSDVHGRMDLFEKMLDQIKFSDNDFLYVLGDSIDRGGGLKVLQKIMELHKKGQCELVMGNHEFIFQLALESHLTDKKIVEYQNELTDRRNRSREMLQQKKVQSTGSDSVGALLLKLVTAAKQLQVNCENTNRIQELNKMIEKSIGVRLYCKEYAEWESWLDYNDLSEQEQKELTDFLDAAPVQKNIEVNGKSFVLVHGGFSAKKSEILSMREEFWNHPVNKELLKEENLPDDSVVIFGHTATRDISIEKSGLCEAYPKIFHDTDKIGIDCGACFPAGQLACLRLDDMKEFYVKNEETFITSLPRLNAFLLYNVTQYLV